MENPNDLHPANRKVTLSCRVLPEQKLMIAERAESIGMSLAQYVEAKVLQKDNLELEKTIQRQQIEIDRWKAESKKLVRLTDEKSQELNRVQNDFDAFYQERLTEKNSSDLILEINFRTKNEKKFFLNKLRDIARKHKLKSLRFTLKACLDYTYANDNSIFFLETVKGFFRKKSKNLLTNSRK